MLEPTIKLQPDNRIDIEKNYAEFKQLLIETKREGVYGLLGSLDESDFKTAPASTRFHLATLGGLCLHSLGVRKYALQFNKILGLDLDETSITISSLLHDLTKTSFYEIGLEFDKEYKEATNLWRKKEAWIINDVNKIGHGEGSLALALEWGIILTSEEKLSIRWHMSGFDDSSKTQQFRQAHEIPLVRLISIADDASSLAEEKFMGKF